MAGRPWQQQGGGHPGSSRHVQEWPELGGPTEQRDRWPRGGDRALALSSQATDAGDRGSLRRQDSSVLRPAGLASLVKLPPAQAEISAQEGDLSVFWLQDW